MFYLNKIFSFKILLSFAFKPFHSHIKKSTRWCGNVHDLNFRQSCNYSHTNAERDEVE